MNVLIVDDDVVLGRALSRALERLGHSCRAAASVEAALRSLAVERPNLLLTDFDLGAAATGVDLAAWARNAFGVPAILMTTHEPRLVCQELSAAGLDQVDILPKPFSMEDLAAKLAANDNAEIGSGAAPPLGVAREC